MSVFTNLISQINKTKFHKPEGKKICLFKSNVSFLEIVSYHLQLMIFQICRHFAKTGIQTEWRKPFVNLEQLIQHNNHISKPREESYLVQHAIAHKYRIRIVPGINKCWKSFQAIRWTGSFKFAIFPVNCNSHSCRSIP